MGKAVRDGGGTNVVMRGVERTRPGKEQERNRKTKLEGRPRGREEVCVCLCVCVCGGEGARETEDDLVGTYTSPSGA